MAHAADAQPRDRRSVRGRIFRALSTDFFTLRFLSYVRSILDVLGDERVRHGGAGSVPGQRGGAAIRESLPTDHPVVLDDIAALVDSLPDPADLGETTWSVRCRSPHGCATSWTPT